MGSGARVAIFLLVAVFLSGCSGGTVTPIVTQADIVKIESGVPGELSAHELNKITVDPLIGWSSSGDLLIATWGSGSCPSVPRTITMFGSDRLDVTLAVRQVTSADGGWPVDGNGLFVCTADLTPSTTTLHPPPRFDRWHPVAVTVGEWKGVLYP